MKKSTKNLFKIASIISFAICGIYAFATIFLLFNIGGTKDMYIDLMLKMGMIESLSEASFEVSIAIFDCLVAVLLNSYCAGVYLKIYKSKTIILGGSRVALYQGILQCFFFISIIPGVMAIVGSRKLKNEESEIANRPRDDAQANMDEMSNRIEQLKLAKEKGEISEEQYTRSLNDIVEKIAKSNAQNTVVDTEKTESLQDKIKNVKDGKDDKKDE